MVDEGPTFIIEIFTSYLLIVVVDELVFVGDHLHLVFDPEVLPEVVAIPENAGGTELTSVLYLRGETVLVLSEVLQGGPAVSPPDVQHQLYPALEDGLTVVRPALPPV